MPRVLIAGGPECAHDLPRTILERVGVEREFVPSVDLARLRFELPDLLVLEACALEPTHTLLGQIRADAGTRRLSVIVLSRLGDVEADDALRRAGANAVLTAPPVPVLWERWFGDLLSVPRRQQVRLPVGCRVWSHSHPTGPIRGFSVDMSSRGLLLETPQRLEVGSKLDLVLRLPLDDAEVRVTALVVRDAGGGVGGHRSGIDFVLLRDETRARVARFLDSVTAS
jgi:CheY-like chemotaxis protein